VETYRYKEDEGNNNNNSNELDLKWKSTKLRGVVRDSSVGIATCYGMEGPGIEFRWGQDFPHPSRPALYNRYWVFLGGKSAEAWRWLPTPSSADVKESVEVYIYSLYGLSWLVLVWPLPLPLSPSRSTEGCVLFNHKNYKRGVLWYKVA
jgi:hypothetical protein